MSGLNLTGIDNGSCPLSLYDTPSYKIVAGVRVVTGLISFLCCLLLVAFFIYTRKRQRVTNQILVFYLVISTLLHSFSYLVSRVNFYTERPHLDNYCLFAGPLELYAGWTQWMCVLCISLNLLVQVTCQPKRSKLHWLYLVLIFVLPLLWCWVPFVNSMYATSGPWCGVRVLQEDCESFTYGLILRLCLIELPILILFASTTFSSVATWLLLKHKLHTHEPGSYPQIRPVDRSQLVAELKVLLWLPPLYAVLQLLLLANLAYDSFSPQSPLLVLWYLEVLTAPFAGAVVALVTILKSETGPHAHMMSWVASHTRHKGEPQSPLPSSKHVSEYMCERNLRYGDSLEGVQNKRIQDRVTSSDPTHLPAHSVAE